ncbi:phosphoesterase family-domain-containing protein [Aspergillus pseudotamarii]|uniref:Phosphoesterase family-domain-containing protein n=1 Tax=Aspergillus pseudotamarii TaxID=132259 RepID=A0A5N6T3P8_ASPPS|nr:phosphoesterase family-domain-containing protein [Aspergillus pseudotamarii]KAE8140927.1 phosphoesterase family-domain-containing protein [Aspergillus pseudotamarii]
MKVLLTHTLGLTLLAPALVLALPPYPNVTIPSGPSLSEIEATAATTLPESPVSNVRGLAFDRFYQLWMENTNYEDAAADENITNYFGVTHPSQPNYCASVGGDTWGMDHDSLIDMPANISTIVDLLDTKDISWGEYQEHLPYAGFQGFNYSNQATLRDDYARRHNPLINFRSVTNNETRARQIKSFTDFQDDLANKTLPQWAFITPNVTNDAHDTNITFGAKWERGWISDLLKNPYFMNNTLVLLTFDEDAYLENNRVFSVLVGGAIPDHLRGTKDDTFYTHYSSIATVSANWGLPSLGRWDCGAKIFEIVSNKTGYVNYEVDTTHLLLNQTYPGPAAIGWIGKYSPVWPIPITDAQCSAGHGVLGSVKSFYGSLPPTYNYTSPYPMDAKSNYNMNATAVRTSNTTTGAGVTAVSAGMAVTAPSSVIITLTLGGFLFCLV